MHSIVYHLDGRVTCATCANAPAFCHPVRHPPEQDLNKIAEGFRPQLSHILNQQDASSHLRDS